MTKVAIDVITAELLAMGIPITGLTIKKVEETIIDFDPNNFSEKLEIIFFLFSI